VTAYTPASSLGWLDFDAAASERVAALLRSLEEPRTLDPLGLGTVRDAFSWMLSPGASTTQTKLRYFIFLPWIFSRLQAQRVAPADFARRLRDDEARLIDCLRHLGKNKGVIGYTAGRNLKLMPSWLYWGGLGSWGLRRLDLSIGEYGQRAAELGRRRPERDDDRNATAPATSMWAPMPPAPDDFLQGDISFELSREEAQVLVENIRRRCPGTLLAFLCGAPATAAGAEYPWEVPTQGMAESLVELLRHARSFSELTLGPQLVYNMLVARAAREELGWDTLELEERQRGLLRSWAEQIAGRGDELRSWVENRDEFWQVLTEYRISGATRTFVQAMSQRAVDDPGGFAEDPEVHRCIVNREIQLKSKRARLAYRSALENWNGSAAGGQLDYRWSITRSYLADLDKAFGTAT